MFEQLRGRRTGEAPKGLKVPVALDILRPDEVADLNLTWNSHFNNALLRQHLLNFPALSLRLRGYSDYIVGDNWRRRDDIGQLTETHTRHYRAELVAGLLAQYVQYGYKAIVVGNDEQSDNQKFYHEAGFTELERIVYYEKPDVRLGATVARPPVMVIPYVHTAQSQADLLAVDNASFPWLWWNSSTELEYYRRQEGVIIYLAYTNPADGQTPRPVGYFGFTLYDRWAHLDRLAVVPEVQGQGVGAYQLGQAITLMGQLGARRVTLSTQLNNVQSQRLYEGFGFQRVKSLEYALIGKWLDGRAKG